VIIGETYTELAYFIYFFTPGQFRLKDTSIFIKIKVVFWYKHFPYLSQLLTEVQFQHIQKLDEKIVSMTLTNIGTVTYT